MDEQTAMQAQAAETPPQAEKQPGEGQAQARPPRAEAPAESGPKTNKWYAVLYGIVWFFFSLVHPIRAVGRENLPREGGALLCGNHTCMSDPLCVVFAVGRRPQLRVMAKIELMRIPVLGFILKKVGVIGVDRGKADVGAIKESLKALKGGEKLLLFPEGTRVAEGEDGSAHNGAAMLATRTGVPVVPVYIPRKKKWFRRTTVVIGKPYTPSFEGRRPTPEDYARIGGEIMGRIDGLKERAA